ncbi:MAG TPA: TrmH family RNA methyltransferase, partial [Polyangia bacterium]|nr:TrmH family RNA methyltransferase [Polyangia bacterium]
YWPRVRLRVWPDWARFERELPSLGEAFCFSANATRDYWDVAYPSDTVLVFGRESVGLDRALVAKFGERALRIPMLDEQLRSLNLSTAGALAAYEVVRQRRHCVS